MAADDFKMEIETEEITCDRENLLDYTWLFNNIPWMNHDGKNAKVTFAEPIEMHCIVLDGYDTKSGEMKSFEFDNAIISAMHGYGGNSFTFQFRLGEKDVHTTYDYKSFAYTKNDVKKVFIDKINSKIKGLRNQIKYSEDAIEIINAL
jgi:hypothetical protein